MEDDRLPLTRSLEVEVRTGFAFPPQTDGLNGETLLDALAKLSLTSHQTLVDALIDDRFLLPMYKLDRILDRHNMTTGVTVTVIDHCCQRSGFSRTGGSDKQHQASLMQNKFCQNFW